MNNTFIDSVMEKSNEIIDDEEFMQMVRSKGVRITVEDGDLVVVAYVFNDTCYVDDVFKE